jgi:hypothetical protein
MRWIHDVFGNSIAIASFAESAAEFRLESRLQLETYTMERPQSEIAPEAANYPLIYSADDRIDLGRMLERTTVIWPIGSAHGLAHSYAAIGPIRWRCSPI